MKNSSISNRMEWEAIKCHLVYDYNNATTHVIADRNKRKLYTHAPNTVQSNYNLTHALHLTHGARVFQRG